MILNLYQIYKEVSKRIKTLNFHKIWNGFKPFKFALYNDEVVIYEGKELTKTNQFMGNTAIDYNGEQVAIWKVTKKDDDYDILTSKIVHEMFHAFQINSNESRFPKEMEAIIKYKYNAKNLNIKLAENYLLSELVEKYEDEKFKLFLSYRNYRRTLDPFAFNYEASIEVIEGTANYVELKALEQLNKRKSFKLLNRFTNSITNVKNFIPVRIISYDVGAIILKIILDNNIPMDKRIFKGQYLYINQLLKNHQLTSSPDVLDLFSELLKKDEVKLKKTINKAIKQEPIIKGKYKLHAFNVYDARYYKGFLITNYFLGYIENGKSVFINGDFIVKMNKEYIISEIYKVV